MKSVEARIADSVQELKKLRKKRKMQLKLKKLEQMKLKYEGILTTNNQLESAADSSSLPGKTVNQLQSLSIVTDTLS